jgi:hypothetical protein
MNELTQSVVTILLSISGVAMLALLVSKKSQTPQVIQSLGSAYSNALGVAIAPVTGQPYTPNLSYPGTGGYGIDLPVLPQL